MKIQILVTLLLFKTISHSFGQVISTNLSNGLILTIGSGSSYERRGITNAFVLAADKQLFVHGINGSPNPTYISATAFVRIAGESGKNFSLAQATAGSGFQNKWSGTILGPLSIEYGIENQQRSSPANFSQSFVEFLMEIKDSPFQMNIGPSAQIASTAVVVPSNAVGDVDVLLEQSNDMITWTQCLPGTYNASTQKRFFRVRAVEK